VGAWAPKAEQVATAKFLTQSADLNTYLHAFKSQLKRSLDALYQGVMQLKSEGFLVDSIEPMGAIYLTVKVDYTGKTTAEGDLLQTSADVNFYLIKEAKIAFVPFSAFGSSGDMNWFRASIGGCSLHDIQDMLPRLKAALQKLN
jgi:aspartate aminotransferase